jgi:hypothetical protein
MRGQKKPETQKKLDRERVLPFYLTVQERALYDQDDYKYLIHLLKVFPTDEFHILQYLLLKFHPLIIKVCRKYYAKKIDLDWTDLISFARYSLVELVLRFDLTSTLYFRTYIQLALDRAVNDYHVYDIRRHRIRNAIRLDKVPDKEIYLREQHTFLNQDMPLETEHPAGSIKDYRDECIHFVEKHPRFSIQDKDLFYRHFVKHEDLDILATQRAISNEQAKRLIQQILLEVKEHIAENFL